MKINTEVIAAPLIGPNDSPADIVDRLRIDVQWHHRRGNDTIARDCADAADEIERLRTDRDRPALNLPIKEGTP